MFVRKKSKFTLLVVIVYCCFVGGGIIFIDKQLQHKSVALYESLKNVFVSMFHYLHPHANDHELWDYPVWNKVKDEHWFYPLYSFKVKDIPTTRIWGKECFYKDVEPEYQGIVRYYELENIDSLTKYTIPWILEENWVSPNVCHVNKQYIYPYAIGLRKNKKLTDTQAEKILDAALRLIENKTFFHQRGDDVFSPHAMKNEYYELHATQGNDEYAEKVLDTLYMSRPRFSSFVDVDNYRVYLGRTWWSTEYELKYNYQNRKRDMLYYRSIFISVATFLLIVVILMKNKYESIKKKRLQESLYDRFLRASHPKNYLKLYDREKVQYATDLYEKLLKINQADLDSINSLYESAREKLGINVLDNDRLDEMQNLANPRLFMKPFNEKKVSLANTIYGSLVNRKDLSYEQYVKLEEMLIELYKD